MSSEVLQRSGASLSVRPLRPAYPSVGTALGPVSVQITSDIESLRPIWEELQEISPCTPSQTYSSARAWVRHVVEPEGRTPVIALGRADDDGRILFLWAFEVEHRLGLDVLVWLGQQQANYAMGLTEPQAAETLTPRDIRRLVDCIAASARVSAAMLQGQPFEWGGVPNPFAGLPHQPHPSNGYAVMLGDFDELYLNRFPQKESRRKYTRRERKLAEIGPLRFGWSEGEAEKRELIDIFFAQREKQFARMGIADPFTPPVRAFYRELALLPDDDPARLRLGYVRAGDSVLAMFNGAVAHGVMAVMMSSLAEGDAQRHSPGIVLLRRQIEDACRQGLEYYDIGVGAARHKERWCDISRPLFDCYIAFKPQGLLITVPLAMSSRIKRWVKNNRVLWPMVQNVRKTMFGISPEHGD